MNIIFYLLNYTLYFHLYFNEDENELLILKKEIWKKDRRRNKNKGFWFRNTSDFGSSFSTEFEQNNLYPVETTEFSDCFGGASSPKNTSVNQKIIFRTDLENLSKEVYLVYQNLSDHIIFEDFERIIEKNLSTIHKSVRFLRSINQYAVYKMCDQLDVSFEDIIQLNDLELHVSKSVKGDGNCYYRAISHLMLETEKYFYFIKVCILFIIYDYKDNFKNILLANSNDISIENLILNHCNKSQWADEVIQIASSLLLDKSVFIVTVDNKSLRPHRNKMEVFPNESNPIIICFKNAHFVPLLRGDNEIFTMPYSMVETDILLKFRDNFEKKYYND